MKITKRQLRRLIREAMVTAGSPFSRSPDADRGVELTEPGADEASISAAWPDKVYYNGESVFETFYSDAATAAAWRAMENEGYDDGQEAYLGYSPTEDVFVMGFDVWPVGEDEMEGVLLALDGNARPIQIIKSVPGGMYPGGRNEVRRRFPDIIDVRLD